MNEEKSTKKELYTESKGVEKFIKTKRRNSPANIKTTQKKNNTTEVNLDEKSECWLKWCTKFLSNPVVRNRPNKFRLEPSFME